MLSQADLKASLAFVDDISTSVSVDAFAHAVVRGLRRLIPCDIASYDELNPIRRRMRHVLDPPSATAGHPHAAQALALHASEHPLVRYYLQTGDRAPMMISDFLTLRQFRATGLYYDVFRPVDVDDVITALIEARRDGLLVAAALLRSGRAFGARDRRILELLQPHLVHAYRAARAREELELHRRIAESTGSGLVVVRRDGTIRLASPSAMEELADCFPEWNAPRDRVPRRVAALLGPNGASRRGRHRDRAGAPPQLMAHGTQGRVSIRVLPLDDPEERLLVVQRRTELNRHTLASLGLSDREVDVVRGLTRGRTNAQIAAELDLSASTVKTHIERIGAKLGVHTRTEIATISLEAAV